MGAMLSLGLVLTFFSLLNNHVCHLVVVNKQRKRELFNTFFTATRNTTKSLFNSKFQRVFLCRAHAVRDFNMNYVKNCVHIW